MGWFVSKGMAVVHVFLDGEWPWSGSMLKDVDLSGFTSGINNWV